ncbi:type 2 periplasmic-binding domain-containing protein [Paenibacillus roseipurpureus]|uniref:ABC transporter substrate-binding protein n=1 Tax=Paenibacillus roseopurpureus TaxID=2918901 RepID=A0AA96LSU0_9BACL|nr:hypothetical protein [Paenibacillus sp. MBLB1832]WNR45283.1 hypothetical protein MJB10_03865 [Paenibacillus sp. MBLB1832]
MLNRTSSKLAALMSLLMAGSVVAGCTTDKPSVEKEKPGTETTAKQTDWSKVKDSSELPEWKGKQLSLRYWDAHGTGNIKRISPTQDVVNSEIKRVTGVEFDKNTSFDNGGESLDAKLAKVVAAKDYPDIASGIGGDTMAKLAASGAIYELTDLLPKYAPDIYKGLPKEKLPGLWNGPNIVSQQDGKIYGVPISTSSVWSSILYPDTPNIMNLGALPSKYGFLYVRDDILKQLYPNVKSNKEIEELYIKNGGKFSKEELFDVPIKNKDDFYTFLKKIKDLNVKEDGKPVSPFYAATGGDNWNLMTIFGGHLFGRINGNGPDTNYFTYFDKKTNKMEYMFKQTSFIDELKFYNKLVRDGLASKESLIDNASAFNQKRDSGQYAVLMQTNAPDSAALKKAGKTYEYRKVWMDIVPDTSRFLLTTGSAQGGGNSFIIFKDKVKPEDVPQILQYFNYLWTEAGKKVVMWGPKSAGLFTEENGVRKFKDVDLENEMVYSKNTAAESKRSYYNLEQPNVMTFRPSIIVNNFDPRVTYPPVLNPTNAGFKFDPIFQLKDAAADRTTSIDPSFYNFSTIDAIKKFTTKRTNFELALTKILTAANDTDFDKLYADFLKVAEESGMTDAGLKDMDTYYREVLNKEYMKNIK